MGQRIFMPVNERKNADRPAPFSLEWEDLEAFHARFPYGAPLILSSYDRDAFWKYTDFQTEAEARAFVAKKRETFAIGYAGLYRRENISDDGYTEPWGWVCRWQYDEEFMTDDL